MPGERELRAFADDVGSTGPVTVVGGRTHWDVGGPVDAAAREVRAPDGILAFEPAEMIVRCGAGTTVAELDEALAGAGQVCPLDPPEPAKATVGGVLAVGRSGLRRLGHGPLRDLLLEARYVSAEGAVVKAGGPVVKNVSGFDLCRLLVGSLGTIGLLGQVVLRARPRPPLSRWFSGETDPFALRAKLHAPSSILWDGSRTWLLLEGEQGDVAAQAALAGLDEADGPPPLPPGGRRSLRPRALRDLDPSQHGPFLAEVGVGIVHGLPPLPATPEPAPLHRRVKALFDPVGRLNPGRSLA